MRRGLLRLEQRIDAVLVPRRDATGETSSRDFRPIVLAITGLALGFFIPSLPLAGVPSDQWLAFTVLAMAGGLTIAWTFLVIPRGSPVALLAPVANGAVLSLLSAALGTYYPAIALLFPLIVSSHAIIHGIGPGLVAVVVGTAAISVFLHPAIGSTGDVYYTALYLAGAAAVPWAAWRLAQRRATALGRLQRQSESQRAWLEVILRSVDDAVIAVDGEGKVLITNAAYDRLVEAAGGALVPRDERGRRLPQDRSPEARAARGEAFDMPFTLTGPDGERRWFEARGAPIVGPPDSPVPTGGVITIRDTSARSLLNQQEAFMATASHELRTPIAALHGYVQLLERRLDPNTMPREAEFARIALSQTRRLNLLLERLFDLARLQSGRLVVECRPIDLVEVVRQAIDAARALAPEREFQLEVDRDEVTAYADPDRVEQVLLNLITNAIQHAPDGGAIGIRVTMEDSRAAVAVQDHGPGIPPKRLARLFSASARAHGAGDGLGLGLFIARELVRAQGGSIEVDSELGEGTTTIVRLRLASAARSAIGGRR